MTDPTAASLEKITSSTDYEKIESVPVFDEHDEYGPDGRLLRRFGRAELQEIADESNKRARDTGTLTLIGPGHTVDDQFDKNGRLIYKSKETDQPPVWGYGANYRVEPRNGKNFLVCDWYVHKKYRAELGSYPHRSIELWFRRKIVDWIAALRRPPERDLGLLIYSLAGMGKKVYYSSQPVYYDQRGQKGALTYLNGLGKLRYSMEAAMADETHKEEKVPKEEEAPVEKDTEHAEHGEPAEGVTPEFHMHFMRSMKHHFPHLTEMHGKYAATLSASNGAIPAQGGGLGEAEGQEKLRMQREQENTRAAQDRERIRLLEIKYARSECERSLIQLEAEGFEIDRAAEVERMTAMDEANRPKHLDYIRKYHRQAPVSRAADASDIAIATAPRRDGKKQFGEKELDVALKYQRQKGCSWEEAESHALQQAS